MTDPSPIRDPVIIVGCPRSGTTLLRTMLEKHPGIHAHPDEPQFILGLSQRFGSFITDVPGAVSYVSGHPYFPATIDKAVFIKAFDGIRDLSLKSFFEIYFEVWGGKFRTDKLQVIKHPELVYHLDMVSAIFQSPYILHIVRDPRSSVLSQRNRWPNFSVWECAMRWKSAVRCARSWASINHFKYHELSYEKLVLDPETALSGLLAIFGLSFSPQMLSFNLISTRYTDGIPATTISFGSTDPTRIDLWKTDLSSLAIRQIEFGCKEEMSYFEYLLASPSISKIYLTSTILLESFRHWILTISRELKSILRQIGWRLGIIST